MTSYSEVFDLFLVSVQDYKIDRLYSATPTAFENYLTGFLIKAIPRFDNCAQDLEDRDDTSKTFNITLTTTEKVILSNWMVYEWLQKNIQDIRQMNLHLNDTDFKHYSEQENLKGKMNHSHSIREIISQDMTSYELKNVDWTSWASGVYE